MYDIRQFRPTLYVLLLLGISGFALAMESPPIFLVGVCGIGINAALVAVGRFRPLPRLLANLVTLAAVAYIVQELTTSHMTPVMVVGQFLVFLQLVKIWEQRANRDYAQLLILSLLLMVAASMNTASMWFGLILVAYLFLSLYCCLLFHLKVETDAAQAAMAVAPEALGPNTLRQDQRHLSRSMRRLTGLVAAFALSSALLVFVLFPRGSGAGLLGPMQQRAAPLVGFSEQVRFQDVARITQSHEKVAFVKVWHGDKVVEGTETLMLRGLTLDVYQPPFRFGGAWEWTRSAVSSGGDLVGPGRTLVLRPQNGEPWRQQINLWPTRTTVLFAMPGAVRITPETELRIRYSLADGALETTSPLTDRINYEVVSSNLPGEGLKWMRPHVPPADIRQRYPRVFDYALRSEVSGPDASGSLGQRRMLDIEQGRLADGDVSPLDEQIAANIEAHLRDNFTYTLDLTDEREIRGAEDSDRSAGPIEDFLYRWKRGHCEYFAGTMTLLCQSLGMQARMVIGFKCGPDDYNDFSKCYTVYDSDAHAWVEVRTTSGWKTFDPTSPRETPPRPAGGLLADVKHLLEYLEQTYATSVIAYDGQTRDNLIASVEVGMTTSANRGAQAAAQVHEFIANSSSFWNFSTLLLTGIVLFMVGTVAAALGWYLWERWRLRRRAARIGIESLPEAEQLRLARQLGFYDDLLKLLDRHRIVRPSHFTPMEFGRSLTFLPSDTYEAVQRLTGLFYRVRYGGATVQPAQHRRLSAVVGRLAHAIAAVPPASARSR